MLTLMTRVESSLLVLFLILPTLFLLLPSFVGALIVIGALSCHFLGRCKHGSLNLVVVPVMIFHHSLNLDFMRGSVG